MVIVILNDTQNHTFSLFSFTALIMPNFSQPEQVLINALLGTLLGILALLLVGVTTGWIVMYCTHTKKVVRRKETDIASDTNHR